MSLSRRRFLSALGTTCLPLITLPGFAQGATLPSGNILILIELAGGNDGLNTLVPTRDPAYKNLRPTIGITQTLTLDDDTGLHPSMRGIADLWDKGEARIIEGVGYPNPNRSHFRSIEIWNAGQGAMSNARDGWIADSFATQSPAALDADGLVLGGDMGPLTGQGRFSAMRDEDSFRETLQYLADTDHPVRATKASPLDHILATYESAQVTGDTIARKLDATRGRGWAFPETELGEQLRTAARLLEAGVDVPVFKVVQDGYDTHDAQPYEHAQLLEDLSNAIHAFSTAMRDVGLWDQVSIVTYSEFGRTARENGSGGTDHGTAAPVFAIGGQVQGGLAGQRVSLDNLVDGDLAHTTDYRSLYAGLLRDLWQIDAPQFQSPPLRVLR